MITAVLDACVLYPAPLRDSLIRLAIAGHYHARWTQDIHQEWTRNILLNRPDISESRIHRTRDLMNQHVPDLLVTGYAHIIHDIQLPHRNDLHVLAAAIHAKAHAIVTFNLADFPANILQNWNIQPVHPDDFIYQMVIASPQSTTQVFVRQCNDLKAPRATFPQFLETLLNQGLPKTTAALQKLMHM